jgi:alkylation response protein AidB-like acyl-CoA dehydrogenase
MFDPLIFPPPFNSVTNEALRDEVRSFIAQELAGYPVQRRAESWSGFDPEFSRKVGVRGWIGMTWPRKYGGAERSTFDRYIVMEEMLAAGAPVAAHWIADRQTGPLLLRYGSEQQKSTILPRIAAGQCFVCIGMSEPDCGSDLAAVRTRAIPVSGGYRVNGTKVWTTIAHYAHFMVLFCRTSGSVGDRQAGTSQFLIDLKSPGIGIRPIVDLAGQQHFNEVSFEDVFVPAHALIGQEGSGWDQVSSELVFERSGPERFLSSFTLLIELVRALGSNPSDYAAVALGRLIAHIVILRRLSRGVAVMLESGSDASVNTAIVKDLGTFFEQEIPEIARNLIAIAPSEASTREFLSVLSHTVANAPAFSVRGGTREILRGIIARGLGLR